MHITGIYAALAALLVLVLAASVSMSRRKNRTGIGDGGHADLALRIRAHANAVEYLPLALLLLLLLELNQTQASWLHVFGIVLIVSRVLHALGLSRHVAVSAGSMYGIFCNCLVTPAMSVLLLWQFGVSRMLA